MFGEINMKLLGLLLLKCKYLLTCVILTHSVCQTQYYQFMYNGQLWSGSFVNVYQYKKVYIIKISVLWGSINIYINVYIHIYIYISPLQFSCILGNVAMQGELISFAFKPILLSIQKLRLLSLKLHCLALTSLASSFIISLQILSPYHVVRKTCVLTLAVQLTSSGPLNKSL